MTNDIERRDGVDEGLTPGQKKYSVELLRRLVQNRATAEDFEILASLQEKDRLFIIERMLDGVYTHPDFFSEGEAPNNIHKNIALRLKLEGVRSKTKLDSTRNNVLSINALNKLRGSVGGGPKYVPRKTQVVDVSEDEVIRENDAKVKDVKK